MSEGNVEHTELAEELRYFLNIQKLFRDVPIKLTYWPKGDLDVFEHNIKEICRIRPEFEEICKRVLSDVQDRKISLTKLEEIRKEGLKSSGVFKASLSSRN